MARPNPNTPFGLRVIQSRFGSDWRDSLRQYFIPAADANAYFEGDAIVRVSGSTDPNGVPGITLAAAGGPITGVICGFMPMFSQSGTPGPQYRAGVMAAGIYVLVNDDPTAEFMIQENDNTGGVAGTPLPLTAVGKNANLVLAAGSPYTGWSGAMLDANTVADNAALALTIKGFVGEADNVPAALYSKVVVMINNHTEVTPRVGI